MKFIKQNLTLVICGAVVILAIAFAVYSSVILKAGVQEDAAKRFNTTSGTVISLTNAPLAIPGRTETPKGVPTANLIEAKKNANEKMTQQADAIVKSSAEANHHGRVDIDDKKAVVPILEGKKEANFLPVTVREQVDPMAFKEDYGKVFPAWLGRLAGSTTVPPVPPRPEDLTTAYAEILAKRSATLPPGALAPTPAADQHDTIIFQRSKIMDTAMHIHVYVDPTAFQIRPWLATENPPTEQMIFESLVDSWLQGDVVSAITTVNDDALAKKEAKEKNVGASPVKRLIHITVGNDALITRLGTASMGGGNAMGGTIGPLFFIPGAAVGATVDAAAAPVGAAQPNTTDVTRSMTGRASGADYDVVLMQISMDIDPSYLNKFIDQLYRRNMGYTVLSIRSRTIDPLDRVSNGFIYGETQVQEVELLVECLLFRTWTQPIMPEVIRTQLGIPPDPPKP